MSFFVFALVMLAAFLHAFWNFLVKGSDDKILNMAAISIGSLPLAFVVWITHFNIPGDAWTLVIISIILHCGYQGFLAYAYRAGDLSRVYPIARGTAPLLVTVISVGVLGAMISMGQIVGIVLIVLAVFGFVSWRGVDSIFAPATVLALITGVFIASYSLVDGYGARISGNPLGFYSFISIGTGVVFLSVIALKRPYILRDVIRDAPKTALIGGNASYLAYLIVVWAFAHAPIAIVTALRETSIMFAAVLGVVFLGERLNTRKVIATIVIVIGVIVLRLAG